MRLGFSGSMWLRRTLSAVSVAWMRRSSDWLIARLPHATIGSVRAVSHADFQRPVVVAAAQVVRRCHPKTYVRLQRYVRYLVADVPSPALARFHPTLHVVSLRFGEETSVAEVARQIVFGTSIAWLFAGRRRGQ